MRAPDEYRYDHEQSIHWLRPEARDLPYVRESTRRVSDRRAKRKMPRQTVAYVIIKSDAGGPIIRRGYRSWTIRFWWLASHDCYHSIGGPMEAVDPTSIQAGQPTRSMTDDQWNRQSGYQRFVRPSLVSDPMPRMWR